MAQAKIVNPEQKAAVDSPWSHRERAWRVLWEFCWLVFCVWTPKPFNPWRLFWLRVFDAKIHGNPFVHQRARIAIPWNLTLYDGACLGERANAYSLGEIEIRAHATVAQEAYLSTGSHDFSQSGQPLVAAKITIGEAAFLGARVFVMPGITIGARSVVGACSVVTKDIPEAVFAAGNPCKVPPLAMNGRVPVSVIVPIRNEAANLARCLASVSWADEVFVVDSQSSDGSIEIAKQAGAQVVQFQFNGAWPKKKNWALENLLFRNEWVFILDADEVLPPEAETELARSIHEAGEIAGYWINRRFMFMGRWLRHAYYPNWNLRLFRHSLGRYEKLTGANTASGDNEVHEHVVVRGATARLRSEIDHYAFPSVEVFIEKHNRYSNWEARVATERHLAGSPDKLRHPRVERRRKLKLLSHRLPFRGLLRFLYVYVWQKGFLDGREGYYFARLHGVYEFLSVAKTYELLNKQ